MERELDEVETILECLFYDSPLVPEEKELVFPFRMLALVSVMMLERGGTPQYFHLLNFKHNYIPSPVLSC